MEYEQVESAVNKLHEINKTSLELSEELCNYVKQLKKEFHSTGEINDALMLGIVFNAQSYIAAAQHDLQTLADKMNVPRYVSAEEYTSVIAKVQAATVAKAKAARESKE